MMVASEVTDWAVAYRPARGRPQVLWMVITGVPAELERTEVGDVLERWAQWPTMQSRLRPGGNIDLYPRKRFPAPIARQYEDGLDDQDRDEGLGSLALFTVAWGDLTPESKRITVIVDGPLYAAVALAARRRGMSLQAWCLHAYAETLATDNAVDDMRLAGAFPGGIS